MKMKKVSVIIPVYNKRPFLNKCLESVVNQSYKNLQIIIIDDGSNDGSKGIIHSFLKKDKRLVFIEQTHAGVSMARNRGIEVANGEYLIFLDADDELEKDYVELLVNHYKDCQLVVCGLIERDYASQKIINKIELKDDKINCSQYSKIFNKPNYSIFSLPCCKLFSLSIIKKIGIRFTNQQFGEDSIFVLNYLSKVTNISIINECGYINNLVPKTLSRKYVKDIDLQLLNILKQLRNSFPTLDEESWNFMLCRSIKLTLFNAVRPGFKNFIDECKRLFNNSTYNNIKVTSNLGIKDTIVVFMFKNRLSIALFLIFKLMSHSN